MNEGWRTANEAFYMGDPEGASGWAGAAVGYTAGVALGMLDNATMFAHPETAGLRTVARTEVKVIARAESQAARKGSQNFCCFVAGTLVTTKDGLKPIETIAVGDLVLSKSDETGEIAFKPVTDLIPRHDRVIWTITVEAPSGKISTYETTDEHPWWTLSRGWKRTDELQVGTVLLTADGVGAKIVSVKDSMRVQGTYNLEVADFHTYFVGVDQIWVHNSCGGKNGQKFNEQRRENAANALKAARENRDALKSVTNKTPADKAAVKKAEAAVKKAELDYKKSENHSMKDKK